MFIDRRLELGKRAIVNLLLIIFSLTLFKDFSTTAIQPNRGILICLNTTNEVNYYLLHELVSTRLHPSGVQRPCGVKRNYQYKCCIYYAKLPV